MKDFLGNDLGVGDYVAAGGKGNGAAEYGMILHKVIEVSPKLKLVRLQASYPTHNANKTLIKSGRPAVIQNSNKYIKIVPPADVADLFEKGLANTLSQAEMNWIGKWIHGSEAHQLFPIKL